MNTKLQKKLVGRALRIGKDRVKLKPSEASEIKEAITKADIKDLIKEGSIVISQSTGISRARARERQKQRKKGRQRGHGNRKGRQGARTSTKETWMRRIRLQRAVLKALRDNSKISKSEYRSLYLKSKGGFFRSKRHINLYLEEHNLLKKWKNTELPQ